MHKFLFIMLFLMPLMLGSVSIHDGDNFAINDIEFNLVPLLNVRTAQSFSQGVGFIPNFTDHGDSCSILYESDVLNLQVSLKQVTKFNAKCWQVSVSSEYLIDIDIRKLALTMQFNDPTVGFNLKGPQAIYTRAAYDNKQLCPYTDKAVEISSPQSAFWIVASNYEGCSNVENITDKTIWLYDNTLHYARQYTPTDYFHALIDLKPCTAGQNDEWSFLIFEQKPVLLSINRWPGNKKAALAFTNDADGESLAELQAIFYGSSNPASPKYMTMGFVANNLRVSNTVFGMHQSTLGTLWNELKQYGNTIGYHTYTAQVDLPDALGNNLLNEMTDYNIRLWIDHSWANNPEDLCVQGGIETSPYYILDILNQSNIDYAWCGDVPITNPFDAFEEPWRLPHKLYHFKNLTRPVWFFGRTRMEAWEYLNHSYMADMKHNLTVENLDRLLQNNGLCIAYTHFAFSQSALISAFFEITDNGDYEIKDEVNDLLITLNQYQQNKHLWIAPVEEIFDRMLAIEQVQITEVDSDICPDFLKVTVRNTSDYDLQDLLCTYNKYQYMISDLSANTEHSFLVRKNGAESLSKASPYRVYYKDSNVFVMNKTDAVMLPAKVDFYNIKGQLVKSHFTAGNSNYAVIPFQESASGVYFARITSTENKSHTIKFTVIR
ncbi:MAG: T9SS type A sorting domain-containing protein [Candidatus Cloacimonetes bacterium]|nr:T9SS type A sorting domain-containing protein [Candidatus Cloacimonadota bacterium]